MTDTTTTRPGAPADDDARNTLETAICIGSIASDLKEIGMPRGNGHFHYLGSQLAEHQERADDAFNRSTGSVNTPRPKRRRHGVAQQ